MERLHTGWIRHEHPGGEEPLECLLGLDRVQQQPLRRKVVTHAPARDRVGGTGFLDRKCRHCTIIAENTDSESHHCGGVPESQFRNGVAD